MTRNELSNLYWINRDIERLQAQIKQIESVLENNNQILTGMPFADGVSKKIENYAIELADLKQLLDIKLKECFYERNRIIRFIETLEDRQIKNIFFLRYVRCLTWQKIAYEIGHYNEQYPRRLHNRFLKKLYENDERKVIK